MLPFKEKVQTEGGSSNDFVVANPGAPASSGWQLKVADLVVVSENTLGEFEKLELPSWIGVAKQSASPSLFTMPRRWGRFAMRRR